ncbi:MAG: YraN family protein [Ignavibacteria bacterium]|nr:YraN family protein [Ignavibacteria bacterium]
MRTGSTKEKGDRGEELALTFLRRRGFRIAATGYRYGRGEVDIIAYDGDILVFCEVKARMSDQFGEPEYGVTRRKQLQIRKVAEAYLFEHDIRDQVCRFDVIAVRFNGDRTIVRYLRNAF